MTVTAARPSPDGGAGGDLSEQNRSTMTFHPVATIFPLINGEDFDSLVEDVRANGLREPIWLHEDGRIIDGRNRWRACEMVCIVPKMRTWIGKGSLVEFVLSLNLHRRHLTTSQRACVAVDLLPLLEAEAKARQEETSKNAPRDENGRVCPVVAFSPPPDKGKSREKAAKAAHVGSQYVSAAKKLKAEDPDVFERVRAGEINLSQAKADIRKMAKAEIVETIKHEPPALPEGPYRVIVIDPTWQYNARAEDATHRAGNPYPDMALDDIKALPVAELAHEDCIVWLWTTNAFLKEAFECLKSWGFENKTVLTWVKPQMGLGDWLRGKTEHCLMAVRGKPVVVLTNQTTALAAETREHSRKPDEFYAMVDTLCPGNKLEMFARELREGWRAWGAEVRKFAA